MSGEIFDGVLPFPVRIVVGWAQNAGSALFGAFVVTVSQYNREEILRLAPNLDPSRVHVLASGIDVDFFKPRFHAPHAPFRFTRNGWPPFPATWNAPAAGPSSLPATGNRPPFIC